MTKQDIDYIGLLLNAGLIKSPVLELGAGYGGNTCRNLIENSAIKYFATDVESSDGVDYVSNFMDKADVNRAFGDQKFETVLVLNVLEHTFDPLEVMDNALSLVNEGGVVNCHSASHLALA